ncbi:MAG: hypothetical protein AB9873_02775 [Syntrophobacteraceae bacterium]
MSRLKIVVLILLSAALLSCAHLGDIRVNLLVPRNQPCAGFLRGLDQIIAEHGVRDASTTVVGSFPYLRADRFHAALWEHASRPDEREQWVDGMRRLFRKSIRKEIRNLPAEVYSIQTRGHSEPMSKETLLDRAESCSTQLYEADRKIPGFHELVHSMVHVPDEYSYLMRTIGVHPVAALPVIAVTNRVRKKILRTFETPLERLPVSGTITTYRPTGWTRRSEAVVREVLDRAAENPLQIPLFTPEEQRDLAHDFAPVLFVDRTGSFDLPGAIVARKQGFDVDPGQPALYYYVSYAFKRDQPVVQINYVVWFPERAGEKAPSIEHGHLDGLTIRVTLDRDGRPFMMDAMNNCGCYHFFVPERNAVARIKPKRFGLDPFVPQWLPSVVASQRFGLRVNTGWHQVERVLSVDEASGSGHEYQLVPYERLESLDGANGLHLSLFNERGIARGTGRIEPLIFFSMGIPSVGSMRQRGNHPIDLVGRAHFDDPNLFDKHFELR